MNDLQQLKRSLGFVRIMDLVQSVLQYLMNPIQTSMPKRVTESMMRNCSYVDDEYWGKKEKWKNKKKKVQFETLMPLIERDEKSARGTQVKIVMTKEEALRMLSKCRDGGVLEFKDVAGLIHPH